MANLFTTQMDLTAKYLKKLAELAVDEEAKNEAAAALDSYFTEPTKGSFLEEAKEKMRREQALNEAIADYAQTLADLRDIQVQMAENLLKVAA